MKSFFLEIKQSVWGPQYYHAILARPFSSSLGYFSKLAVLLSLCATILFSLILVPNINTVLMQAPTLILETFPDDLVLRIDQGNVSINQPEPYFISIPERLKGLGIPLSHLFVIDTKTPFSKEQYDAYKTVFWVTGSEIISKNGENSSYQIQSIDKNYSTTIDQNILATWLNTITPYFKFVAPVLVMVLFAAMLIWGGMMLVYLNLIAVAVYIYAKIMKKDWGYGYAYQLTLHAFTLPFIVGALSFGGIVIGMGPLVSTIIVLFIIHFNMNHKTISPEVVIQDSQKTE